MPLHSLVFRFVCLSVLCLTAPPNAQVDHGEDSPWDRGDRNGKLALTPRRGNEIAEVQRNVGQPYGTYSATSTDLRARLDKIRVELHKDLVDHQEKDGSLGDLVNNRFAPLALLAKVDPVSVRKHMDANRWWFTMAQCTDGGSSYQPNLDNAGYGSDSLRTASAVVACIFTIASRNLVKTGKEAKETRNRMLDDQPVVGAGKPAKVFVLAGQSNMEGQGFIKADPKRNEGKGSLEFLAKAPATAEKFKHLLGQDGKWAVRDDVYIHYLDRKGKLTVGYGAKEDRIGPELGFGHVIGEAFEEPVLLIKLAWGGKSLAKDFRPPSSGGEVGPYYTEIVKRTNDVLANLNKEFPEFGDRGYELAGFGWHQGWNDRVNQAFNDEYEKNMANFIRDIREDLGVKNLPFVIAETGMSGKDEKHPRALSLMKAQAAVAESPEFKGNVAFVGTREFWREKEVSPSGQGYHWNTNAETYYLIGEAMGTAMKKLCERKPVK